MQSGILYFWLRKPASGLTEANASITSEFLVPNEETYRTKRTNFFVFALNGIHLNDAWF